MKKWKTGIGVGVLILGTLGVVKLAFFTGNSFKQGETVVQQKAEDTSTAIKKHLQKSTKQSKSFVTVTFLGTSAKGDDVYKFVKRPYNKKDGSKLKVAINALLDGPNFVEKTKKVYSEIPAGVNLISVDEFSNKTVVNLSDAFENGGGTNSLYKRLYQLIKTANRNSKTPVYLYINGKQVDVIGGDGIMITQPLSDKSLDE